MGSFLRRISVRRGFDPVHRWLVKWPLATRALVAGVLIVAWALVGATVWVSWDLVADLPGRDQLNRVGDMAQATTIYDAADRPVFTIFKEQRIDIPLDRVSPHLIRAILAIEDQRFYEHHGVDVIRVAGSAIANLREGRRAQGASTITQQLARQSFLTRDKTLRRKLKEVILAAELEARYSKRDILQLYLNKVYFGDGLYGAEAAALGYFGRHAADLNLGEAALLAGLVKSPSTWAPTVNLERALARRELVLQAMVNAGAITAEEARSAAAAPVAITDGFRRDEGHGAYFKEEVRRELVARFGLERVYEGGLRAFTAYDPEMQQAAEREVATTLEEIEKRRRAASRDEDEQEPRPVLQAALVALDPDTGDVQALVGGRSFDKSHFNRAVQAYRQPGSAFKPFVYAAALESGWSPASIIDRLDEPIQTLEGDWIPEEGHSDASSMTLRSALRLSSNRAAVRLLETVGIDKTVDYAGALGLGETPAVPSAALGSGEVTLQALTAAYAAFASEGIYHQPRLIRRVEDREGRVLYAAGSMGRRVLSEQTAFLITSMLADVVNSGTAWKARQAGFRLPAAGKTGTTNDYVDAWFVGFTPTLVSGVWIGFDQPKTIIRNGYAGDLAVPLWARFMKAATEGDRPEWYSPPRGLVQAKVCRLSGLLPNVGCGEVEVVSSSGEISTRSMIYTEYFPRGKTPVYMCPLHQGESMLHRLAGVFKRQDVPPPVPAAQAGVPEEPAPEPVAATARKPADEPPQAEPERKPAKKRGFWSRVFGIGGGDGNDEEDDRKNDDEDARRTQDPDDRDRP